MTAPRPATPPFSTIAAFSQFNASVAGRDGQYMAAWLDTRSGANGPAIWAGRVSPDGTVLDPHGKLLGPAYIITPPGGFRTSRPRVLSLPEMYLVVWERTWETLRTRVSRDGKVIDAEPQVLYPRPLVAAASTGTEVLIVTAGSKVTHGVILGPDGELRTGEFSLRSTEAYDAVAAAGDQFVLVGDSLVDSSLCADASWCQRTTIEQIDRDGTSLSYTILPFRFELSALGSDGSARFLLIYRHHGGRSLMARLLSPSGELGDEILLDLSAGANSDIVWNGTEFIVVWEHIKGQPDHEVRLARISPQGNLLAPPFTVVSLSYNLAYDQPHPALGAIDGGLLLAWTSRDEFDTDLQSMLLTPAGFSKTEPFEVTRSPHAQFTPNVSSNGSVHLNTWVEYVPREGSLHLRAARFDDEDRAIDLIPIEVARQSNRYVPTPSATASDGQSFLIVWSDRDKLFARRLEQDGIWATSDPIEIASLALGPSPQGLIWTGKNYFLVYLRSNQAGRIEVVGIYLDSKGSPIPPAIPISDPMENAAELPVIAFNGSTFLVVWSYVDFYACNTCLLPPPPLSIRAARVTQDGIVLDRHGIRLTRRSMRGSPSVAWGGGVFLIVWQGYGDIRATRFSPDGMILDGSSDTDGMPLFLTQRWALPAGVAWDGQSFVVFWRGKGATMQETLNGILYDPDEPLVYQRPVPFLISEEFSARPTFPAGSMVDSERVGNKVLIAYTRVSPEPEWGGVRRIFTRALLGQPPRARPSPRR